VLAAASYGRLGRIDSSSDVPEHELKTLTALPLFRPLPMTTLERLAARLRRARAAVGSEIVREGDERDLFYVITSGVVEVSQVGRPVAMLGPLDYFGEIALLRDVPRVATCRAKTDVELSTLERQTFVSAVSGHTASAAEAESVTDQRLAELEVLAPFA
jgi:CRP-like cAMP-binding protein